MKVKHERLQEISSKYRLLNNMLLVVEELPKDHVSSVAM
jgi:hypothetical protein